MKKYDILFISQFTNLDNIRILTNSILNETDVNFLLILVNQTSHSLGIDDSRIIELCLGEMVSLSKARNIALQYIKEKGLSGTYFMFPDDDAYLSSSFFDNFNLFFLNNRNYLLNVIDPIDGTSYKISSSKMVKKGDFKHVMSSNLLISEKSIKQVGFFNEELGVGAKFGSSEDIEYYLRCYLISPFYYLPSLSILHPLSDSKKDVKDYNKLQNRMFTYSDGYIKVLLDYGYKRKAYFSSLKALLAVFIYFFNGRFKLSLLYFRLSIYRFKLI